ncbi:MAG: transporter substrate-binding domain-containing protein [Pseudomonadota bacterium]
MLKRRFLPVGQFLVLFFLVQTILASAIAASDSGVVLQRIKERGFLICGTGENELGFAAQTDASWSGLYVDLCRALAAATLQDGAAVKFRPLAGAERFAAVARGEVDILARSTALAFSSDTMAGAIFVVPFYYDGTGFLIRKSSQISSALELSGAQICLISGSLARINVNRFFQAREMKFSLVNSDTWSGVVSQFTTGSCTVMAADLTHLAIQQSQLTGAKQYALLPEIISTETFGPTVASHDWIWFKIVRWVVHALIRAEELGISKDNVRNLENGSPVQKQFLETAALGARELGLHPEWLIDMLEDVGNYGEIYERNLGKASGLDIVRRLNALTRDGGLLFAPAFR